jgi:hypothetical protein
MRSERRNLSPDERALKFKGLSLFQRGCRRLAREEASAGWVEVLTFRIRRAWCLITCSGPPCCPNSWLVETTDGEYAHLESWRVLRAVDGSFPGDDLVLSVWPTTKRILAASAQGTPVLAQRTSELLVDFGGGTEVELYASREELPAAVAEWVGAA